MCFCCGAECTLFTLIQAQELRAQTWPFALYCKRHLAIRLEIFHNMQPIFNLRMKNLNTLLGKMIANVLLGNPVIQFVTETC
ncbi:hypothetical protein HUJ05_003174 [Dendroctonus ponderosae]|nr:hypothetical protein HUJ05_003174 [Dendroctonus ponderosae]